jgi:membrane protein DedA with SNARE-associated domain
MEMMMSDVQLSSLVLNSLLSYGTPVIMAVLFLSAFGAPLPATLTIIAAGALVRLDLLDSATAMLLGLLAVVIGDNLVYALGRFARRWSQQKFGESDLWRKAQALITRRGGVAIYLTRWLITTPAIPVTLAAAGGGVSYPRFLFYDIAGELTWIAVFGGLGYAFGGQWEQAAAWVASASGPLLAVFATLAGAFILLRYGRNLFHKLSYL